MSDTDQHRHEHTDHGDEEFTADFWDERYGSTERVWSGDPNPHLVALSEGLTPGTALDVGSGEGADAIWLAGRGWTVTGVDVSGVALRRAAVVAERASLGERCTWERADLRAWDPAPRRFDLVSAQFMYLPPADISGLFGRLAASVSPDGTLLVVGHHPADVRMAARLLESPEQFYTAEEVARLLDPAEWVQISATAEARPKTDNDGRPVTAVDTVLVARRRGPASSVRTHPAVTT